jgi:hypothetical protein
MTKTYFCRRKLQSHVLKNEKISKISDENSIQCQFDNKKSVNNDFQIQIQMFEVSF